MTQKRTQILSLVRRTILVFSVLLMAFFPNASVFAQQKRLSDDPDFLMGNDIIYYDPGSGGCVSKGSGYSTQMDLPTLTGNDNAEKIWNFLKQEGFSDEQSAGVMGNIRQESNYDPTAEESPESAARHDTRPVGYGLIQWSGSRRNDLRDFASEKGLQESDLALQLMFLKHEASTTPLWNWQNLFENFGVSADDNTWDALKNIDGGVDKTTKFFHDAFERSGDYTNHGGIGHRIESAKETYEKFTGKSASGGAGGGGSSTFGGSDCKPFAGGDLQQTVLEYAWPEFRSARVTDPGTGAQRGNTEALEMKPAYAAAVKKAQADTPVRGVGGVQYPGIDCAGFVSLLIVDSGFDPEYNTKGTYVTKKGFTTGEAIQKEWMEANWEYLGDGGDPKVDAANLRPGDVAVSKTEVSASIQHIFIFVGEIEGFGNVFASASLDERAPMAAGDFENSSDSNYEWYRKK